MFYLSCFSIFHQSAKIHTLQQKRFDQTTDWANNQRLQSWFEILNL